MKKNTDELLKALKSKKEYEDLGRFLKENEDALVTRSLAEHLASLMKEKGLTKSRVIRKSNLDKNYAYQLFNGIKTNPSRDKIIMLAFGMGLDVEQTARLLKVSRNAGLYVKDVRDSVILFCLNNSLSLIDANEYLSDLKLQIIE